MKEVKIKENKFLFFMLLWGFALMVYTIFVEETFLQVLSLFCGVFISVVSVLMMKGEKK